MNGEPARSKVETLFATVPSLAFDDLLLLAAQVCDAEIALISLLDADQCWFKTRKGSLDQQTARALSSLGWCPPGGDLFIVTNAFEDARFAQHPLVRSEPYVHFYAAMPLETSEGYGLGNLCVVDAAPRSLSKDQQNALRALGRQVVCQLDLLRQVSEREGLLEDLDQALKKIQILTGLLPICSSCKKIRDDQGYWDDVDHYIQSHSQATFTHGVCPKCLQQLYPDYFKPESPP